MPVAELKPAACGHVEGFVRGALGCSCPPAVFGDIRLETGPAGFPGFPDARLLSIGGRLLVLLVDATETAITAVQVAILLRRGRVLRDAGGFNRFRLVVVAPAEAHARLAVAFDQDSLAPPDGRLHLHTVTPTQLPVVLQVPVEAR